MSNSKFYVFEFKTKAEALKFANKLMRITAKGEQAASADGDKPSN